MLAGREQRLIAAKGSGRFLPDGRSTADGEARTGAPSPGSGEGHCNRWRVTSFRVRTPKSRRNGLGAAAPRNEREAASLDGPSRARAQK